MPFTHLDVIALFPLIARELSGINHNMSRTAGKRGYTQRGFRHLRCMVPTWRGSTGLPWSDMTSDDVMPDDIMSGDSMSEGNIISEDDTGRLTPTPTPALRPFLLLAAADALAVLLPLLLLAVLML